MTDVKDFARLTEQRNKEVAELKQSVRSKLENDLAESTTLDRKLYNELKSFLSFNDIVDLNFIVSCLCEPGYWQDFYINRCPDSFMQQAEKFFSLLPSLKSRYIDC